MCIERALAGDWNGWKGLAGSETLDDLEQQITPITRVLVAEERTRIAARFLVTKFERGVAPKLVEGWFLKGHSEVLFLEYDDPPVKDLSQTLEQLGTPETVLQDYRLKQGCTVKERVYAQRGVVFSIAKPYGDSQVSEMSAVHAQLFKPCSLHFYITRIGPGEGVEPKVHPA